MNQYELALSHIKDGKNAYLADHDQCDAQLRDYWANSPDEVKISALQVFSELMDMKIGNPLDEVVVPLSIAKFMTRTALAWILPLLLEDIDNRLPG